MAPRLSNNLLVLNDSSVNSTNSSSTRQSSSKNAFAPLQRKSSIFGEASATSASSSTSTSTSSSPALEVASAQKIRSRYLYKLGVGRPTAASTSPVTVTSTQRRTARNVPKTHVLLLRPRPSFQEPLKGDLGRAESSSSNLAFVPSLAPLHSSSSSSNNKKRQVRFRSQVGVHSIPHKSRYSAQDKQRLWTSPQELEEAAYRNCVEFAAEQWDWRQAVEECDFVLLQGVFTHPAHAHAHAHAHALQHHKEQLMQHQRQCTPNRQFCRIFSAQRQRELSQSSSHRRHPRNQQLHPNVPVQQTIRYR